MKSKYFILFTIFAFVLAVSACQTAVPASDTTAAVTEGQTELTEETTAAVTEVQTEPTEETTTPADDALSAPPYEIKVIDGKSYLNFTEGNEGETNSPPSSGNDSSMVLENFIPFSSLNEMKESIANGKLTQKQMNIIQKHFTLGAQGYEICNVQDLIQPVVPTDLSVGAVYWYGDEYTFSLIENTDNPQLSAGMYFGDAGKWTRNYEQWMQIIEDNTLESHETDMVDGVTTETYVYVTKSAKIKRVFLTLPGENGSASTRIMLKYVLQADNDPSRASDTVPSEVFIFGEKNGIPFDYVIHGLTEAPTVEWLSTFTIAPYGDHGDHIVA